MKKNFLIISILFLLLFGAISLYLFELPPFNKNTTEKSPITVNKGVPRNKSSQEFFERAENLEKNNFLTLAIAEYQNSYNADKSNNTPLIKIAQLNYKLKNYEKAQSLFKELSTLEPANLELKIWLAKSYLSDRKPKSDPSSPTNIQLAKEILQKITSDYSDAKLYLAIIYLSEKNFEESKKLFKEIASDQNTSTQILAKSKTFIDAFTEYEKNSSSPKTHLQTLLAKGLIENDEYQIAISQLFDVIKEKNDYRDAWILLGYAYLKLDQTPEAIDSLEEAKKLDKTKPETLFYLGLSYYSKGDYNKALENLELAKTAGYEPKIQVDQKLAEIYLQLNNNQQAALHYESVISQNKSDINLFIRPIWLNIEKLNNPEKALSLATTALENHPQNAMAENLVGWAYIAKSDFQNAEIHLKKALSIDPNLDATYLNFGILFENKNQTKNALDSYKTAKNLGKGNSISTIATNRYNSLLPKMKNEQYQVNTLTN